VVSRLLLMSEDACSSLISLAYGSDQIVDERTEKPVELSQFASNGELDWNERFQQVLASKNERDDIGTLAKDFADASCALAKTIVEEMFAVKRTYHPKSVGGIAGGPKFIENGIFVKLSCDWKGLYGGDSWAIKSASKELLGVETYLDLRIKNLHFPLLALVQYRGHALLCQVGDIFGFTRSERFFFFFFFFFCSRKQSILPIGSTTLQHGSQNAGQTVCNESPALEARLKLACEMLHLAPHSVVARNRTHSRVLYTAADMEGELKIMV
jgi:hypothetical protein